MPEHRHSGADFLESSHGHDRSQQIHLNYVDTGNRVDVEGDEMSRDGSAARNIETGADESPARKRLDPLTTAKLRAFFDGLAPFEKALIAEARKSDSETS